MKVLAVYHLKGGVGKTATTVNLGWLAAESGYRTLIWDLDPQGAATYSFRIRPGVKGGGKGLLRLRSGLQRHVRETDFERLDLVPADHGNRHLDLYLANKSRPLRRLRRLLNDVRKQYDLVLFDCSPGLSLVSEAVFAASRALVLPTIPTPLSLRALDQIREHLNELKRPPEMLPFFCMVDMRRRLHRETIESGPQSGFLSSRVPYSSQIEQMSTRRAPLPVYAPKHAATDVYRRLWAEVEARTR